MKKWIAVLALCLLVAGMMVTAVVPVSAATPKERMMDACEEYMPEPLLKEYRPLIENILRQITVSENQADQVVQCIKETREFFKEFKGISLHSYTAEEREFAVNMVSRICEILGLTAKYGYSTDADHVHDLICEIYDANGNLLGILDGDAVKKTNAPETETAPINYGYAVLAAVLVLGAAAAVVTGKKLAVER